MTRKQKGGKNRKEKQEKEAAAAFECRTRAASRWTTKNTYIEREKGRMTKTVPWKVTYPWEMTESHGNAPKNAAEINIYIYLRDNQYEDALS